MTHPTSAPKYSPLSLVLAASALLLGAACGPANPLEPIRTGPDAVCLAWGAQPGPAGAATAQEQVITIVTTTQGQIGDSIRIGVGNIWEEDFTPEGGAARRELRAGLWITVRDAPASSQHVRAHAGQELAVAGYRLRVLEVDRCGVRLGAAPTSAGTVRPPVQEIDVSKY